MKELKEIEEMTLDDLLQVADDESVSAPDVLKKRLQNLILASTLSKQIPSPADASVSASDPLPAAASHPASAPLPADASVSASESQAGVPPTTFGLAPNHGPAPKHGLASKIRSSLAQSPKSRMTFIFAAAASLTLLLGIGLTRTLTPSDPVDTFDDPRVAYAAIEEVFSRLSGNVAKGMAIAGQANQSIEKADILLNQFYR